MNPDIQPFFDEATNTYSYIVVDPQSDNCAVIDPVLGFDLTSGHVNTDRVDQLIKFIRDNELNVTWILETHMHADHLTAASIVKSQCGGMTGIGRQITNVQKTFSSMLNISDQFKADGSQFDRLFDEGDTLQIGALKGTTLHTPGHTPACLTYLLGNCAFVGDTLFMPDYGTARADFPGGDAKTLYQSIQKIFSLPDDTRIFTGHDYLGSDRSHYRCESTVAEQKQNNKHVGGNTSQEEFVQMRNSRDEKLSVPRLILPSVQINMRGGMFPPAESNGTVYLKLPINRL